MQENENRVMAMYDVRGVQNYIFRTSKLKEAVGASSIVENIIEEALKDSLSAYQKITYDLEWCTDDVPKTYSHTNKDVVVLYIGGNNAYVMYKSREIAVEISKRMSLYVLQKTYSLQLATAFICMTSDYADDYKKLIDEMARIKESMTVSKPRGALPVMCTEIKTGYPMGEEGISEEARLKRNAGEAVRKSLKMDEKQFDNYVFKKGEDSMLAVVRIDGNNMGLRIRKIIENVDNYTEAINRMREISININASYKKVFDEMQKTFNKLREEEKKKWNVMRVIVSGDDVTYVCNAGIALGTVEYFVHKITDCFLYNNKEATDDDNEQYRFSVCAGISYFNSHFPFHIAYSVAEACCDNAKKRAKKACNMDGDMVGNWMDFQFCRNIKAANLKQVRKEEYLTARGESLLRRPYYIPGEEKEKSDIFKELAKSSLYSYEQFTQDCGILAEKKDGIPRSFLMTLRNTYPLGEEQVNLLKHFFESRKIQLPELYFDGEEDVRTTRLYDVLEVADYFQSLDEIESRFNLNGEK